MKKTIILSSLFLLTTMSYCLEIRYSGLVSSDLQRYSNFWLRSVDGGGNPYDNSSTFETYFCKEYTDMTDPWTCHIGNIGQTFYYSDGSRYFPDFYSIIKIGDMSFSSNNHLYSITMDSTIQYFGKGAFFSCISLSSVVCSTKLTLIDNECFRFCSALTNVDLANANISIRDRAFENCNLSNIKNYSNINSIGNYAFANCSGLKKFEVPSSVNYIGESSFQSCSILDTVIINSKINRIKNQTFLECANLNHITFTNNLKKIGYKAFSTCRNLKKFDFSNIDSLGIESFYSTGLTEINLASGITYIPDGTFGNCQSLKKITLPSTIASIGALAFSSFGGSPTDTIIVNAIIPPALSLFGNDGNVFGGTYIKLALLVVPSGSETLYQNALGWKQFNKIVTKLESPVSNQKDFNYKLQGGYLYLNVKKSGQKISLHDLTGQKITECISVTGENKIKITSPNGIYILNIGEKSIKIKI